jgi:GNAT superfamily N-acetyltransferase
MPIRFAQLADVPALVAGGKRMHALTRFKHFDYNEAKVAHSFTELITKGQHKYGFFVAEDGQRQVVGALIGVLEQHIFSDQITASIMHFDVLPESRMGGYGVRLLKAFEQWAANRKVFEITFGINSGSAPLVERFAERMGYGRCGATYVKNNSIRG